MVLLLLMGKPLAVWGLMRRPRACSYPTLTIWHHQSPTPCLSLRCWAISWWVMSAAPALSRSVSHVDQGLPVAFSTAAEPMPLSLPVDCGFSGVAVGVPLGPGFPGVFAADLAAR